MVQQQGLMPVDIIDIKQRIRDLRTEIIVSDENRLCPMAQEEMLTALAQLDLALIACRKAESYQAAQQL